MGDGPVALPGTPLTVQWGLWTVHQGRLVVPAPLPISSPSAFRFVLGDGTLIPALDEAIAAGMRVGGVRRVLVPPKASTSYPYVVDDELRNGPSTKYGRAPVSHDPSLGVQSPPRGRGPGSDRSERARLGRTRRHAERVHDQTHGSKPRVRSAVGRRRRRRRGDVEQGDVADGRGQRTKSEKSTIRVKTVGRLGGPRRSPRPGTTAERARAPRDSAWTTRSAIL